MSLAITNGVRNVGADTQDNDDRVPPSSMVMSQRLSQCVAMGGSGTVEGCYVEGLWLAGRDEKAEKLQSMCLHMCGERYGV